jgi:hypothetical protein
LGRTQATRGTRARHRKAAVKNEGAEAEALCLECGDPVTEKDEGITCAVSVGRIYDTSVTCSRSHTF